MAGGTAAVAAAIGQAIKTSGVIVRWKPEEFRKVLMRAPEPLVVIAQSGLFSTKYEYLTSPNYRALIHAGHGNRDQTVEALKEMLAGWGPQRLGIYLHYPELALVRDDPRVKSLRQEIRLPDERHSAVSRPNR